MFDEIQHQIDEQILSYIPYSIEIIFQGNVVYDMM